jgi:hypothetical protein
MMADNNLPWATLWQRLTGHGCRERYRGPAYRGCCELVRDHVTSHAIERGFDIPRWDTGELPHS